MNYLNKTLLVLITAFQLSAMAETTELQLIIARLSNPDNPFRRVLVRESKKDTQTKKNELLDILADILRDLNNMSLEIFDKDLSSAFIDAINATIEKIIMCSRLYENTRNEKNPYLQLLEEEVFDRVDTKNLHDLFMYFQLFFRVNSLWGPYDDLNESRKGRKELISNHSELFDAIYKYYQFVYMGVTTKSFLSYIESNITLKHSEDLNFYNKNLMGDFNKILEFAKQKREHALNPTGAIKE